MVKLWMIIVSLCQFRNIKISLFSQNISYIGSMQNVDGPERQIQNNKWTMKHARSVCFHNFVYLLVPFRRIECLRRMQYFAEKEKDCMSVDISDTWHSMYKTNLLRYLQYVINFQHWVSNVHKFKDFVIWNWKHNLADIYIFE